MSNQRDHPLPRSRPDGDGVRRLIAIARPAAALVALIVGIMAPAWALMALIVAGTPVVWRTVVGALRGHFAADLVASMAIVGAAALNEPIAGLVVVLMQTGGEALEHWAEGRASAAVRALEEAAPRTAHRIVNEAVADAVDVPVNEVQVGDLLLVRPGELVPCDAVVVSGTTHVDTSRITGEPAPRRVSPGDALRSGFANGMNPLTIRAIARAEESQYARIVQLVRTAQASKAPVQRMADRYAVWFTPLTIVVCLVTWFVSKDPVRVLAVLVVATPCPLILAAPIAVIGGLNRLARRHVIVRDGTALETLSLVDLAVFDKTGTLTLGRPAVSELLVAEGWDRDEVLALASSVEQGSGHLLAATLVEFAKSNSVSLLAASAVVESAGAGVAGRVGGRRVMVGSRSFVAGEIGEERTAPADALAPGDGLQAIVAVECEVAGVVIYADRVRAEARDALSQLAELGLERSIVLSGDRGEAVAAFAREAGVTEARGDLLPEGKVSAISELMATGHRVVMIGDGTNDAPALSAANVGIAMGSGGGGIATEAADVVLLRDDLRGVPQSISIARRTMRITRQSIWAGVGMSGVAMLFAAMGYITPVIGALIQEGIDLAVILNALRASRAPRGVTPP